MYILNILNNHVRLMCQRRKKTNHWKSTMKSTADTQTHRPSTKRRYQFNALPSSALAVVVISIQNSIQFARMVSGKLLPATFKCDVNLVCMSVYASACASTSRVFALMSRQPVVNLFVIVRPRNNFRRKRLSSSAENLRNAENDLHD